ncbi:ribosome-associated protein [Mariprofundus aestuarium]|uniref:Ribosomal silencing factor RsfS n=1 Tax=Mariprofundus aestuarium TaxID=1921086 RepID=A0A2K8L4P4_MARES|nr:ribosome silencing factor [Mariprofundus aestuarium]ATX80811.1 ribosome-associated protein [Mariprofundus aestuarium]
MVDVVAKDNERFEKMTEALVTALEDKKAQDILVIDVRGRCDFTDRFIVASGRSDRQIKALSQSISEVAHEYDLPAKVEGLEAMEWLLVDLGDIVVHLFLPEIRESFQLERLWRVPHQGADATS